MITVVHVVKRSDLVLSPDRLSGGAERDYSLQWCHMSGMASQITSNSIVFKITVVVEVLNGGEEFSIDFLPLFVILYIT